MPQLYEKVLLADYYRGLEITPCDVCVLQAAHRLLWLALAGEEEEPESQPQHPV